MFAQVIESPAPAEAHPLQPRDLPRPVPGPGELLIRVRACGVCRTDLHVAEGDLPPHKRPVVPGHQVVGTIEAIGPPAASESASGTPGSAAAGSRPSTAGLRLPSIGDRVGVAWLYRTDGTCRFCRSGRENLCERPQFTGWDVDGGYAEYVVAPAAFVYPLPEGFSDEQAAPLLCAGIIGYRSLRLTGLERGGRLGLYGFGSAAHVIIQVAVARGLEVYVCTRDAPHRALAQELGARWAGDTYDTPPALLDAAIIFAPAGEIVPAALKAVDRGGRVVCAGIHMSPIPSFPYDDLYWERQILSVANNTREDGRAFLEEAVRVPVRSRVQTFPLAEAGAALLALKHDQIQGGSAVLLAE
jgi:propanol-preferring alcohol dehydrogenase